MISSACRIAMDAHSLRVLEFLKVIELLAREASTELGRECCLRLRPSRDAAWVQRRLTETEQARRLFAEKGQPPFNGITDLRDILARARTASGLTEAELLAVADAAWALKRLWQYYRDGQEVAPRIWAVAQRLGDYEDLVQDIRAAISEDGEVRPDASPELKRLGRDLRRLEEQLRSRLEIIMRREQERGVLQEPVVVQRAGRWCLAVHSSKQSHFNGILHDRSDSGVTVFMEPAETVELGNRLRDTEIAIRQEIARILSQLTAAVGTQSERLRRDLATAAILDLITAKARLADRMAANMPALRNDGYVELRAARHPLLGENVVPNNIWIGRDFTTLIITGPNTGGKTVALRTLGLLVLMAQAGLHIPAGPTSQVNVFDCVFADIGDEQSIEQSLSTFSSHMTQIVRIINMVQSRCRSGNAVNALVLLDEIGAGTDPEEGSALACSILDELHASGCRTVVTTHFNALKIFAYRRKGMENASVEFDVRTLAPTYRLLIGHAGASKALQIAQRLGLSRRVVQAARNLVSRRSQDVERALEGLDRSRRELDRERKEAQELQAQLENLRRQREREVKQLEEERRRLAEQGYERARRIVAEAEEQARAIIAELQRQPRQSKLTQQLRQRLGEMRERVEQEHAALQASPLSDGCTPDQAETCLQRPHHIGPGSQVYVPSVQEHGIVERVGDNGMAVVLVKRTRLEVALGDLEPPKQVHSSSDAEALARHMQARKRLTTPTEIRVIGLTVEEAIHRIEKFLDDALLAGHHRVRIVHGKGTGALRHGLHEWLDRQPFVRRYELAPTSEGGSGVTVVEI
jgi:DNA mismatch repair protein MutS2